MGIIYNKDVPKYGIALYVVVAKKCLDIGVF
jgi:hypothetical protein